MALSPAAAGRPARHARPTQANGLADALENPRDDLDRLIGDLRSASRFSAGDFDRFEERMQMICGAMLEPFRGGRDPSAPPLAEWSDGRKFSALY